VCDEDPEELRKVASTISSLKPTTCRRGRPDEIEWKMMFWSAWTETRASDDGSHLDA
jgi:hypothetical protein